jgi:hypothetical protein
VTTLAAELVAAARGAEHVALLGVVIIIGLVAFAVVRMRRKRETAQTEELDSAPGNANQRGGKREHPHSGHHSQSKHEGSAGGSAERPR